MPRTTTGCGLARSITTADCMAVDPRPNLLALAFGEIADIVKARRLDA